MVMKDCHWLHEAPTLYFYGLHPEVWTPHPVSPPWQEAAFVLPSCLSPPLKVPDAGIKEFHRAVKISDNRSDSFADLVSGCFCLPPVNRLPLSQLDQLHCSCVHNVTHHWQKELLELCCQHLFDFMCFLGWFWLVEQLPLCCRTPSSSIQWPTGAVGQQGSLESDPEVWRHFLWDESSVGPAGSAEGKVRMAELISHVLSVGSGPGCWRWHLSSGAALDIPHCEGPSPPLRTRTVN